MPRHLDYNEMLDRRQRKAARGMAGKARGIVVRKASWRPGEGAERKDLFAALAQIEPVAGVALRELADFFALENDEVRELIEAQFDRLASQVSTLGYR